MFVGKYDLGGHYGELKSACVKLAEELRELPQNTQLYYAKINQFKPLAYELMCLDNSIEFQLTHCNVNRE